MLCVSCSGYPLEPCVYNGQQVAVCPRCGGLWCEAGTWDAALTGEPELIRPAVPVTPARNCLRCRTGMALIAILEVDNLQLERCHTCRGVWFDRGEWDKLAALQTWKCEIDELERPPTWGEWFFQQCFRLPIEFNIKPRRVPWMTLFIIAICTVMTVITQDPAWDERLLGWAVDGWEVFRWPGVLTLITHQFLHAGWLHLLPNMYLLYVLGDNVEDVLGPVRYLVFYLACGAAAAVTQVLCTEAFGRPLPLVGASGSIAGVIAAYLLLYRRSQLTFLLFFWQYKLPAWVWITVWLLSQMVAIGFDPGGDRLGIAFYAHVGGFLAGIALILPVRRRLIAAHSLLDLLDRYQIHRAPLPVPAIILDDGPQSDRASGTVA